MPRRAKNHIPNPVDRHVGNRMRLQRMSRGHTTYSLAAVLGINERTYRDYETAALRLNPYRLMQIARALGVDPGFWFVGAPTGFEPAQPIDTGSMGDGDTRRLLRAWDAITGKPRKHLLGIAIALASSHRVRVQ
ncbi:helix-turn-helix transcriptional regulator [Methylobacterium sp. WL18]|uniref:helix-turn-helix domain-containing protein n=1 Tax=Methylobacterium sp. WL18 TaxID=2603897 RepID=UPI0011CBB9CA|nr:helix-turn-helix transcriptional regulator [Methylobacterium sp. WL18]TXN75524.1 helix-turn-helix transcriptional regulator [Methylobacterium sp. WL18]